MKVDDLSQVTWNSEGKQRNQSAWLDRSELNVSYSKTDAQQLESPEALEAAKVGTFCVRFTVLPINVDKVAIYGGIIPLGKEHLRDMVQEAGLEMESPLIPTLAMKLNFIRGKGA